MGIHFSKSFNPQSVECEEVIKGRLLKIRATFITVYAPTVGIERLAFLDTVSDVIRDCNDQDLYL